MVIENMQDNILNVATLFFAACGGFVTLATALEKMLKALHKLKQPNHIQDEKIDELYENNEKIWSEINNVKKMHKSYVTQADKKFELLESTSHLQLEAILILLSETGNGNSNVKKLEDRISHFLITKSTTL